MFRTTRGKDQVALRASACKILGCPTADVPLRGAPWVSAIRRCRLVALHEPNWQGPPRASKIGAGMVSPNRPEHFTPPAHLSLSSQAETCSGTLLPQALLIYLRSCDILLLRALSFFCYFSHFKRKPPPA